MNEREIFLALLELPDTTARSAYLDQVCAGDPQRRAQFDSLLASHDTAASFLGIPAIQQPGWEAG